MTIFSKNLEGHGPFAPPGYVYAAGLFFLDPGTTMNGKKYRVK